MKTLCYCVSVFLVTLSIFSFVSSSLRIVNKRGMKVIVLNEEMFDNLRSFLDDLEVKRRRILEKNPYAAKSSFLQNLIELEDRVPVVIGVTKRVASPHPVEVAPPSTSSPHSAPMDSSDDHKTEQEWKNPVSSSLQSSSSSVAYDHQESGANYYNKGLPSEESPNAGETAGPTHTDTSDDHRIHHHFHFQSYDGSDQRGPAYETDLRPEQSSKLAKFHVHPNPLMIYRTERHSFLSDEDLQKKK